MSANSTISHYRIIEKIGAGGMGEVWRASDTRLDREVAIKLLPASFASDPDRLRRFEQEARATSALNHPNILTVYDTGIHEGAPYLVEELLDGEELRAHLNDGALPVRRALDYARQIAAGLAAAHERGVVHRDLKPENLFITADERVKILDFGLAKLMPSKLCPTVDTEAETRKPLTDPGIIMGTVGYMSPEQVRGQELDHRSDIFSFGAILYEVLTGRRAFSGGSFAETLSAILKEEPPDIIEVNNKVPPQLERIVCRCLEKKPERRFQTASDLAFALEALSTRSGSNLSSASTEASISEAGAAAGSIPSRAKRERLVSVAAVFFLLAALALLPFAIAYVRQPKTEPKPVARFEIAAPANVALNMIRWPAVAVSPDGSTVAFAATSDGISRLYLRRRDDTAVRALTGTEGASNPVFSPDGKWIAFVADFALKKVPLDGLVTTLTKVGDVRGITWAGENDLIYTPHASEPLFQISANGGEPRQVSTLDAGKNERTHRWPQVLPGGRAVIFTVGTFDSPDSYERSNIEAVILATGERRILLQGASMACYVSTGHLVFSRGGSLFAVGFDAETLTTHGTPESVLQGIAGDETTGAVHFSVAADGTLAYIPGNTRAGMRRLFWIDRDGNAQPINLPAAQYNDVRLSPDGSHLALLVGPSGSGDVWVYNFARSTSTRLTFNTRNASPVWSADSKSIFYSEITAPGDKTTVMRKPADGSREAEPVAALDNTAYVKVVAADGASAIFDYQAQTDRGNILQSALAQGAQPSQLFNTDDDLYGAALSPDGRLLAYQSNESGRPEIYVRDLTGSGGRWQVSVDGGEEPRWSYDGRELFFRNNNTFMSAAVERRPSFQAGTPRSLFNGIYNLNSHSGVSYDVDPKGGRFLMIRPVDDNTAPAQVQVVLNWFGELRRLAPAK